MRFGVIQHTAISANNRVVSSATSVLEADFFIRLDVGAATSSIPVSFPPAASNAGRVFYVKRLAGPLTRRGIMVPDGTDTIDGSTTFILRNNNSAAGFISDGVDNWSVF